jgi:hypothetical protein
MISLTGMAGAAMPAASAQLASRPSPARAGSAMEFAQVLSEVTAALRAARTHEAGAGATMPTSADALDLVAVAAAPMAAVPTNGDAFLRAAPVLVSRAIEAYRELINLTV